MYLPIFSETVSGKRKRPEGEQNSSELNGPNKYVASQFASVLSAPDLPKLEPIDYVESEYSETISKKQLALASFFDTESTRHVTNKPGMLRGLNNLMLLLYDTTIQ